MVLELAVASRARYIVTFNEKHFAAAGRFGIQVVTPKAFLDVIGGLTMAILSIRPRDRPAFGGEVERAVAISTSGGSANVIAAFGEARAVWRRASARRSQLSPKSTEPAPVVLSGGVFQNELLLEDLKALLGSFRVWSNREVPASDGGVSLGQAALTLDREQIGARKGLTALKRGSTMRVP